MNEDTLHPSGPLLDALAIGEGDDETRAHVASCAACTSYVDALTKGAAAFALGDGARADVFVQGALRRERAAVRRIPWAGVASALALAAGVMLFLHSRDLQTVGTAPASSGLEGPVRFKGGLQAAIIVEHAGAQSREKDELTLAPGDRIRMEVALDHDVRLAAGVLADDGEWAELQAPALLTTGTHYSEQAVTFDHEVPQGWVIVGSEDDVARARRTRDFHDVTAIRVHPKPP